ncbi:hypothetical protein CAL7102_03312 [Dulcicalothrix desertica PCC 7102]|nr:hypothetical protein CAL7102_03312 [Dulcicalothrix desertica PCC 7102]
MITYEKGIKIIFLYLSMFICLKLFLLSALTYGIYTYGS